MSAKRLSALVLVAALVMLAVGAGPQVRGNAPPTFQAPDANAVTIPYSGTLTDGTGQPVPDGAYTFAFTLYGAETDGEPLWTETQEGVTVKGGVFVALLGSVNGIPPEVAGKAVWLEVAVRGPGEAEFTALTPRQRVSAVSAAMSPGTAGTQACPHNHWGEAWSGSGNGLVLYGNSNNYATLYAEDQSPNGGYGVYGRSTKGIGVLGRATATSGANYGVYGRSDSPEGYGVYGQGNGAAIYGQGNVKQNRTGNGLVKAGVYMPCGNYSSCAPIRSFNNVTSDQISGICGAHGLTDPGWCTIDFNFNISDRFWVATADIIGPGSGPFLTEPMGVTCMLASGSNDRLECVHYRASTGSGWSGNIMVLVY